MSRSAGHCMTMGTASTMACMVEALGMGCRRTRPSGGRFAALRVAAGGGKTHRGDGARQCEDVANLDQEGI